MLLSTYMWNMVKGWVARLNIDQILGDIKKLNIVSSISESDRKKTVECEERGGQILVN